MDQIIAYATCFLCGSILGWGITVINWRIKQTDFEIKYYAAMRTIDLLKEHPELGKTYEERGR